MAVASEAGELLAEFRWRTVAGSYADALGEEGRAAVRGEIADVLIFLVRLADVLDIDLADAVREKQALNSVRFPI